jgi:hypothetical protein
VLKKPYPPGLPDGLFFKPKIPIWVNLGIFYDHLVYFAAIGNILWPFVIFCGHFVYIPPFWYFVPWKIWQPWS